MLQSIIAFWDTKNSSTLHIRIKCKRMCMHIYNSPKSNATIRRMIQPKQVNMSVACFSECWYILWENVKNFMQLILFLFLDLSVFEFMETNEWADEILLFPSHPLYSNNNGFGDVIEIIYQNTFLRRFNLSYSKTSNTGIFAHHCFGWGNYWYYQFGIFFRYW